VRFILHSSAKTMLKISLQRVEEVYPALKHDKSCTILVNACEVASIKTEPGTDIDIKVEEFPEAISFPEIKTEPVENQTDLLNSEPGSSNQIHVTSLVDGNEVTGLDAESVSDVSEVANQETTTFPAIKTQPNRSGVPVVSVMHIYYKLYPDLPSPIAVCPCETKI